MFLQAKKTKKNLENDKDKKQDLSARLDQDISIHSMPAKSVLANSSYASGADGALIINSESKHKKIGLFIIVGSLLVVGGIIYAAYTFMIKPAATSRPVSQNQDAPKINSNPINNAVTPDPILAEIPTNINEASLATITTEVATSSASSSLVFQGEGNIIASSTQPVVDSDSDTINDLEEVILGSNPNLEDTDADGFSDLAEIQAGYDPISTGKLDANVNLAKYSLAKYEILYPKIWALKPLATDDAVIFTAADESFIQLSVQKNLNAQSIAAWYKEEFAVLDIPEAQLIAKDWGNGVMSDDGLTVYFTDNKEENIYVLAYTPLDEKNLAYPNIFRLMLNSLKVKTQP
ncbi:MAG: hypothetical protein WC441_03595 [Patescibacteria group bacterium]